jgi:peptidoglycan hydrolase-like protein with peptidoglycan-binding domain
MEGRLPRRRLRGADGHPDEPREGSSGPLVAGLQGVLNDLGHLPEDGAELLAVDGDMGPVTVAALGRAQAAYGVTGEDGRLGPATRAALRRARDGAPTRQPRRRVRTLGQGEEPR